MEDTTYLVGSEWMVVHWKNTTKSQAVDIFMKGLQHVSERWNIFCTLFFVAKHQKYASLKYDCSAGKPFGVSPKIACCKHSTIQLWRSMFTPTVGGRVSETQCCETMAAVYSIYILSLRERVRQRERGEEKFATVGSSLVGCANRAFSFYNRQVKIAGCLPGFLAFYVLF